MKHAKVGIVSPFYKNYNYGGKLQAYALTYYINQLGYNAEQIQYYQSSLIKEKKIAKVKKLLQSDDYRHAFFQKILGKFLKKEKVNMKERIKKFDDFDDLIPHTKNVFDDKNIKETCELFNTFICGSDQIWNPQLLKKGYFLDFVPNDCYRFSYAASIANELNDMWKEKFKVWLKAFNAISVREKQAKEILDTVCEQEVQVVADPTLLLKKEEWDKIASKRMIKEPYIFCYYLGYGNKLRKITEKYAKKKGLKIVTLPHLLGNTGRFYRSDINFGDVQLYAAGPAEFLSLIKYADKVMTDSFHAMVISFIYQRQFIIFDRIGFSKMGSRIETTLGLFGLINRHCNCKESYEKVSEILDSEIHYGNNYPKLEELVEFSKKYIVENLRKADSIDEK